ncbi:MAG: PhzF family phenazine biosynthesis protein [Burkholderiaceae bacterium]|nr:PhzF family phenazine biosynthesis protein [Burkholderiaceae bacterium]
MTWMHFAVPTATLSMTISALFHVDVFATRPLTGNGLTVFLSTDDWTMPLMQRLTQEMRQFESIFLSEVTQKGASARVFTVEEELPFAGHPILGAAAVLHRTQTPEANESSWILKLSSMEVPVRTKKMDGYHLVEMNQGAAIFGGAVVSADLQPILARLGLESNDLAVGLSAQVVSTGLPYLILPVRPDALPRAAITGSDLEALLGAVGAKFVLVLDVVGLEIRTWDNLGRVEDVATGSAAGPAAAYLFSLGLVDLNLPLELAQGRFAGRPSKIRISLDNLNRLFVSGEVWPVSQGYLEPSALLVDI